ncbi:hypothetical protein [Streptomyces sp. NPDC050560]|uniref:hypothetical protein n=1 Tax=Streptomyces sp. NPDC050560 TaxID=3365630 RepID=UPI0037875322
MRTSRIATGPGLICVAAVAAALPLALAPAAHAQGPDVSVAATGDTVRATTEACRDGGEAALLADGQAVFSQGRQATLAREGGLRRALWRNVSPGSYTVIVMCADGTTAGTGTATVTGATARPASPTPTRTSAPLPSRTVSPAPTEVPSATALAVRGGLGGGSRDHGPVTAAIGATLVVAATGGGTWLVRRRTQRRH